MKKQIVWMLILFSLLLFSESWQVQAASGLEVEADIGINNTVKYESPTMLKVKLINNGEPFSGDFVIDAEVTYGVGSALVYPIELQTGESKVIDVYLDGFSDSYSYNGNQRQDMFHFYEGGIEKGDKVAYKGDHFVTPQMMDVSAQFILAVTPNPDALASLKKLNQFAAMPVETVFENDLNSGLLAEDARGLGLFDTIIFDQIAVEDLTSKQQAALLTWVQQGGKVVFSAKESIGAGVFASNLPLTATGQTVTVPAATLKALTTNGVFTDAVQMEKVNLNEGAKVWALAGDNILAAFVHVGKGQVVQTAFSFHEEPFVSMPGFGALLTNLLQLQTVPNMTYAPHYTGMNWSQINELFPSFKLNTAWIILFIAIYTIIIGPVLYFVLKKRDLRERMWLYVPIIAVLSSLVIFFIGAKDRIMKPQMQQMALFQVQEDGTLLGTYHNALLSNKGGDFVYETDAQTTVQAVTSGGITSSNLHQFAYIKPSATGSQLTLRNVDYWSVRSVTGNTTIPQAGQLKQDLTMENGMLTGTITNELPVHLKDVTILSGSKEIKLGDVKAGATLNVKQQVNTQTMTAPQVNYNVNYAYHTEKDIVEGRLQLLQQSVAERYVEGNQPVIVAWSDTSLVPLTLEGNASLHTTSYFVKPFTPKVYLNGEVTLKTTDFLVNIEEVNATGQSAYIENQSSNVAYMGTGEFAMSYDVYTTIDLEKLQLKQLSFKYSAAQLSVKVYNVKKDTYEEATNGKWSSSSPDDYMKGNQVQVKVSRVKPDDGSAIALPNIELKAEVVK